MHLLGVNCGKILFCSSHHHHSHSSLHEMKQNMKPNLLGIFMILGLTINQGVNAISEITQCQLVSEKTKGKGIEEHEFVHVKHETLHLL